MEILQSEIILFLFLPIFSLLTINRGLNNIKCDRLKTANCNKLEQRLDTKATIYFGLILSFPDPLERPYLASSFDDGHDIAPAAYFAVNEVNNRSDLLQDYQIEILRLDGGCDVTERTVIGVNELACSCENIVGIIGPSCKLSSRTVSQLTNRERFSMITINYGDQYFAGVGNYRYSFGILGPSALYSKTFAELIKYNNWTNYALLYSGSSMIYSGISQKFLNLTLHSGFPPKYSSAIYADTFIPLEKVMESFTRVIVVVASPPVIVRVLCLAYHKGMVFPSYQWVFQETLKQDFSEISFNYRGQPFHCSGYELNRSANGSINLFSNALQDRVDVDMFQLQCYNRGYELQTIEYSKEFSVKSTMKDWAKGFYDAVWALAYALNDSLEDLHTNLNEFKVGSPVLAETIKSHMFNLNFHGITGNIGFDKKTGFNTEGFLNIIQYTESQKRVKIGFFKDGELIISPNSSAIFIDSSFKEESIEIDGYVVAIILVLTLSTLLLVISAQVINIHYRNDRRIKASSPRLNHLVFVGGYVIIIGILLHCFETFLNPTIRLHICNLVPLLYSVGITLYQGTSCVKTWRLNRIYVHSKRCNKEDIKFIKDYTLFGFVITLVFMDLLVCMIWRIVDPLILTLTRRLNTIERMGQRVVQVLIEDVCHSKHEVYWYIALLIPKTLLVMASFLLAFSAQMNIKEFKMNNTVILAYIVTVIFGLGIPLYAISIITNASVSYSTATLSFFLNLTTCVYIIIFLLPLMKK